MDAAPTPTPHDPADDIDLVQEVTDVVKEKLTNWGIDPATVLPNPNPTPKPPQDYNAATSCGTCHQSFTFYRYKYPCDGCNCAFCDSCCHSFIVFAGGDQLKRVCNVCLQKHSPMDHTRTVDIFEGPRQTQKTVLLIPSEQGTRYNYIYTCEELSKNFRVVAMDLPGLGARSSEKVKRTAVLAAIKEAIETHCPGKKATLMGLSMGGYLALQFAGQNPEMVEALILAGCNVEQYGLQQISHGANDLVYSMLSYKERQNIFPKYYPLVDRKRMVRAYMTTVMNYDHAYECANMMMEPEFETFANIIAGFPRKILFLTGEKDYRGAEVKFLQAAQKKPDTPDKGGRLAIFPNVAHEVLLHQDTFDAVHREITDFLERDVHGGQIAL